MERRSHIITMHAHTPIHCLTAGTCVRANELFIEYFVHYYIPFVRIYANRTNKRWFMHAIASRRMSFVHSLHSMCLHKLYCSLSQLQRNFNLFKCQTLPFFFSFSVSVSLHRCRCRCCRSTLDAFIVCNT